jgi:uncharacterized protein (DUF2147 family)
MRFVNICLLFLSVILIHQSSLAQSPNEYIIGDWLTSKKDGVITMYYGKLEGEDPEKIYGKLSWIDEPYNVDGSPKKDLENPNESFRNRNIQGLIVISDLEWEGDNEEWTWEEGSAYDPESGNTYSFKASINPDKPNTLNCRGYIGFSLLGRTEVWTRKK